MIEIQLRIAPSGSGWRARAESAALRGTEDMEASEVEGMLDFWSEVDVEEDEDEDFLEDLDLGSVTIRLIR